jgi:amino acid transporter
MNARASSNPRIGLLSMLAICVGLVIVQGSMISATQGIGMGGMAFVVAMLVAWMLAQFNAMTFSELSLMLPHSGTLATYTEKAIGHFPAIVAVFAGYVVVAVLAIPVEMFLVNVLINELLPGVLPDMSVPFAILVLFAITNYLGADVFSKVQNLLASILLIALILTGLMAVFGTDPSATIATSEAVDWSWNGVLDGSFIGLIALAMWLLVGAEFICPLIHEVKDPVKNIPRAMSWGLTIILMVFLLFVVGAAQRVPADTLVTSELPYLDYVVAVFGDSGLLIVTIMGVAATCSTVNTVLAGVPRMLQGMAENGQAFPQMKVLSRRFQTPWVGIVFMTAAIAITLLLTSIDTLILLVISASTSWLLAYMVAHINVLVLRRRYPHVERPYRTPFYPLPQLLGLVAMGYVALNNAPTPEMTAQVYQITGGMLLVISLIAFLWVRFYMKRGLFEPEPI